jgi:hypothetical protein
LTNAFCKLKLPGSVHDDNILVYALFDYGKEVLPILLHSLLDRYLKLATGKVVSVAKDSNKIEFPNKLKVPDRY